MITDLMKDSDKYENENQEKKNVFKSKEFDIHTLMGDMRRWDQGNTFDYMDYKIDKKKYEILKSYYDEKESMR